MLKRQKTILWLLSEARRPVSSLELTKWSFLLRHEFESRGGSAFYDFVPYRFGPFSFCLFQELGKLEDYGYIERDNERNCYRVVQAQIKSVSSPEKQVVNDIAELHSTYISRTEAQLIDYVYERYSAYTIHSEIRKLVSPHVAQPAVYTAGYEGLSVDAFLNMLVTNGIKRLIDVRFNPVARRYGYHKSTLQRLTDKLDIQYSHFPELGIRSEKRRELETEEDYLNLFDEYEHETLATENKSIREVSELVRESPSALLCMERNPTCCHRSRLAVRISVLTKLKIDHLSHVN